MYAPKKLSTLIRKPEFTITNNCMSVEVAKKLLLREFDQANVDQGLLMFKNK